MSASYVGIGSGPGGANLWDPKPPAPPTPPTPPEPAEFLWSKPERLRDRDTDGPPEPRAKSGKHFARAGGRPVKKAARKAAKRTGAAADKRKRR